MLTENKNIINTNNAQQHHTVRRLAEKSVSYVGDHASEDKHDTKNRDCEEMIIRVLQTVDDTDNTVGEVEKVEDERTVIEKYFSH